VAVLALSLSMGFAEWILLVYRRRLRRALLTWGSVGSFARAARAALVTAVAGYLAAVAGLAAAVTVPVGLIGELPRALARDLADQAAVPWIAGGHLCLGGALFVALLLQSCGRIRAVLIAFATALTAETVGSQIGNPWVIQCAVAGGLFCALCAYALVVLGRATPHR
jgi:hypothetical protein